MWWTKALSIVSGVGTFLNPYKLLIVGGLIASTVAYVGIHIANDNTRDLERDTAVEDVGRLEGEIITWTTKVDRLNDRIGKMNVAQLEALAKAAERITAAQDISLVVGRQSELLAEELEITRFNLVEAIRDDEDFADWVDWSFPLAGRNLLFNATEGRASSD